MVHKRNTNAQHYIKFNDGTPDVVFDDWQVTFSSYGVWVTLNSQKGMKRLYPWHRIVEIDESLRKAPSV